MIEEKYVHMERVNNHWSERAEAQDNEILYESTSVLLNESKSLDLAELHSSLLTDLKDELA